MRQKIQQQMTKQPIKRTVAELPAHEMRRNGAVNKCVNLRHTELCGDEALSVAPQPEKLCDYPLTPLLQLPGTDEWLFYSAADAEGNSELYAGSCQSEPEWLTQLPGEPRCAVPTPSGAVIMLPDGPVRISRNGEIWQSSNGERPAVSPVVITAAPKGTMTKTTSPVSLELNTSGQYASPDSNSLSKLRTALMATYSSLSAEALAGGVWIQPTGVRCRLLDSSGNELWRSPIHIVGIDGWQCAGAITGTLSGGGSSFTTSALHIAAKSFAINVHVQELPESSALRGRATVAVIEATPQLHPVLSDRLPRTRISAITSNTPQISVWMPGVQPEESATTTMQTRRLQAIAMLPDSLMTRIGRIDLTTGDTTVQLTPQASPTVDEETDALDQAAKDAAESGTGKSDDPLWQIISGGEPFSAGCVVQNGDTTVWGNISPVRTRSAHPFPQVASTAEGGWQAALRISVNGSSYVTRYAGNDNRPTSLCPIVMIELPEATSATLYVRDTGTGAIAQADLELTTMANGLMSCHISPGLKPIALKASELTSLPAATAYAGAVQEMRGSVLVAMSSEPTKALCGGVCSQGEIKALATAIKSQSSWDFSRCHVYAFATDGIYTVAANTRTLNVSAACIDTRGVMDAKAVARSPHGVVAIAGGQPVVCTASSVKPSTPLPNTQTSMLKQVAWHSGDDELYFTDTQGNVVVLNGGEWHNILVPERVESICSVTDAIWLRCSESSFITGQQKECHAEWECNLMSKWPGRVTSVTLPINASLFSGKIEIRAHNGAGAAHSLPVTTLNIDGEINTPIRMRILAPWRSCLVMRVAANVSADFNMCPAAITITRPCLR